MSNSLFHIIHLFCVISLVGTAFAAIAAPIPERRKPMLMWSGIASIGVMLTGFGMLGVLHLGWPLWVIVKILCWIIISALVGQPFRRAGKSKELTLVLLALVLIALTMVYLQPF